MAGFKKAERKQAKLKVAITGPSGAGKTFSALALATGLGTRIALIDTENHSASLYADKFAFDTLEIDPPYTVQKYREAIEQAESGGYDVLIIDSISHAWAGEGGLLDKKTAIDQRGGNSFTNWATITKEHEQFKGRLLSCKCHLITTMRSKQDYILEQSDKGKTLPKKVGLAPIQREGMEYEYTIVFDAAMDHSVQISKDRTGLFDGKIFQVNKKTGEELIAWLNSATGGVDTIPSPQVVVTDGPRPTDAQIKRLYAIMKSKGWSKESTVSYMQSSWGITSTKELDWVRYDNLCSHIEAHPINGATTSSN